MTALGLGSSPAPQKRSRFNWGMVAAVLTIIGWLLAAATGVFGDNRDMRNRITVLETQRVEDIRTRDQQRADDARWRERVENKIDALLSRDRK